MDMTHRRRRQKAPATRRAERRQSVAMPGVGSDPDRDARARNPVTAVDERPDRGAATPDGGRASDRWARLLLPMIATAVVLGVGLGVAITRSGLAPDTRAILGLLLALVFGLLLWRLGWPSRRREP